MSTFVIMSRRIFRKITNELSTSMHCPVHTCISNIRTNKTKQLQPQKNAGTVALSHPHKDAVLTTSTAFPWNSSGNISLPSTIDSKRSIDPNDCPAATVASVVVVVVVVGGGVEEQKYLTPTTARASLVVRCLVIVVFRVETATAVAAAATVAVADAAVAFWLPTFTAAVAAKAAIDRLLRLLELAFVLLELS